MLFSVIVFVVTKVVQMTEITTGCDIRDAVPEFPVAVVSVRMIDGFVATLDDDWNETEVLLWRAEAANAELCKLVGVPVTIVKLTILATVFGQEGANDMLRVPDAKFRFETFMTVVELMTKDLEEVTVVYVGADTLLIVPFKKDRVGIWFNEAKVAFPGVSNIVAELPSGGPGIKELIVVLLTTYGIANGVVTFVMGRGDATDELESKSVLLADGVEAIAPLVLAGEPPVVVVAVVETAFVTGPSVDDELVLDEEGIPRDVGMELPRGTRTMVESPRINPSSAAVATPSSPESIVTSDATAKSQNQFILCRFPDTADAAVADVDSGFKGGT
jgi:hypothetical protein